MKNYLLTSFLFLSFTVVFSQARVQIIHNSADAAAELVDVWLDQTLLLDNFKFRTASPFIDAPAGVEFTIAISGPDSQNPEDPLWSENYTLTDGEAYVLVAEGIISTSGYDPATPFNIAVFTGGREIANGDGMTDILSHHGATDAPTIDIYEIGLATGVLLFDNLSYAEFDGYLEKSTSDYIFEVRDESGTMPIAAYYASLQELGLKNKAITLLASGFLNPGNNSNGPAFGLWVAPAEGGDLLGLPVYDPTARVQLIHNSADAAAAVVDVWLNETLLFDNFAFRTASPFIDAPAEEEFTISVSGPDSQNPDNPLWSENFTLVVDQTYILVADGIISDSGYEPAIPFDIAVYPQGREVSILPENTDLLIHHGSTDAPTVDIYETGVGAGLLVDDLSYAEFSNYLELVPLDYIIEIRDETGTTKLASYKAPLETLGLDGFAITVVASGFLNPGNNSNGPAFGLWVATAAGGNLIELPVYDPKSRIQLIHNSADAAVAEVDVWLNETLLLDNFAFRTSSPFIDAPAGEEFTIAIKGPDSQNPDNPLWSHNYTFNEEETYILVVDGIISTSGYEPAVPFDVFVFPNGREEANNSGQTDVLIHHGSTDAPTIDIVEVGIGLGLLVDNLEYSEFAGYFGLATVNYIFQVRDETGITKIAAYRAPLATMGLQGEAISIVASGFLEPGNNSNGPEFGLYIALAGGGELVKMPLYDPTARVQVIHNSADTAAEVVDVWLNQTLLLDNFAFRTASPFINAPANEQFTIAIKGPDSQDPYNPLYSHNYELTEGETYIMLAEGIVSTSGYNPATPFDIVVYPSGRESANIAGRTDILVHHGSTDAPAVDVVEVGLGAGILLVNDLSYAEFSSYLELPTLDYVLEVRDATGATLLGTFRAPLQTLGLENAAITLVASGFFNPAANSDGAPFGLWAAVPSGGPLLELPQYVPSALVQVIHNSGDAVASVVDIWLDENLLLDNFAYRTATPFTYLPANTQMTISVCGPDSQDPSIPLWSQNYTLVEDEVYIMVADGIISPEGYDPATPFTLSVYTGASIEAGVATNTDVLFFHGTTDAPTVDITVDGLGTIVDNLAYGAFDGYNELATANYWGMLTDETGSSLFGRFLIPLSDLSLAGKTLTVLATGFANPGANSNGPELALLAVEIDGTTTLLNNTLGIVEQAIDLSSLNIFPNPTNDVLNVSFSLKSKSIVRIEMMDMTGRLVESMETGVRNAGVYNDQIEVRALKSGIYLLNIRAGEEQVSKKIVIR